MTIYIAGLLIFFGTHVYTAFRSREPGKDLREKIGFGRYMGLYSIAALVGLGLMIWGFGASRPSSELYAAPAWGRHANMALMLLSLIALVATYVPTGYIKKTLKHPMLVAVKLWAFGHLLANGELNSVLLFGSFLGYAILAWIAAKRRGDNGPEPDVTPDVLGDIIALVVGAGVYAGLVYWLHPVLFGVPVLA